MLEKTDNKVHLNKQKRDHKIDVVESEFILNRWDEIDAILYRVFADSEFNDNFVRTRPAEHTLKNLREPYQEGIKHIIALDLDDYILGDFFCYSCL
ncbi:MAG: hypothetical protein O4808_08130 [Trichodesmium sp. St17_bin3_1_1]|nr:hypothetical protein [Trichodesmium sp. St17_bin3_1_1]